MAQPYPPIWILALSKADLHDLISKAKSGDSAAIDRAVEFLLADSLGMWHNRARAKLSRHFKNKRPRPEHQRNLVEKVGSRLQTGNFYEQFKDQLRMAIAFDPAAIRIAANSAVNNEKQYIRKYAHWVLNKQPIQPPNAN